MACRCPTTNATLLFPHSSAQHSTSLTTAIGFVAYHLSYFDPFTTALAFAFDSMPSSGPYFTAIGFAF